MKFVNFRFFKSFKMRLFLTLMHGEKYRVAFFLKKKRILIVFKFSL